MSEAPGPVNVVEALVEALGAQRVLVGDAGDVDERFHGDWSGAPHACPRAVVLPKTTADVAAAMRICHAHGQPVVPQGGLTGLAGGANPRIGDVVISLERMAGVEEIDDAAGTMTVLAGTVLQAAHDAARAAGWELAYDLGARGSCQIGGNLATNAGGNRVIRYGMAHEQVLGLEVVLADGTVVTSLTKMLKNNAGYDIKQVFIGSEGTLGIITRAVLRLHPATATRQTAIATTTSYEQLVAFLRHAQRTSGGITAFEAMWPDFYDFMVAARGTRPPLSPGAAMYVLIEMSGDDPTGDDTRFENLLGGAIDAGLITDATIARSARDTAELWAIREAEPIDKLPSVINFDVSLPISEIGRFADVCEQRLRAQWPDAHIFSFGHIGDSNLHLSMSMGVLTDEQTHAVDDVVYECVRDWHGSVSAEHGIGTLKRSYLAYSRSPEELDVMRRIKAALDPTGILNPGKVLPC